MAHFQSTGPLRGHSTWKPAEGYAPVEQLSQKQHVSVSYIEDARQLSRKESYRPLPHRTLSLLCLTAIILGLIGALEYSLHILPLTSLNVPASTSNITIARRQETTTTGVAPIGDAAGTAAAVMTVPAAITITPVQPSSSFFQAAATTFEGAIEPTTAISAYIDAEGTTVTSIPIGVGTPAAGTPAVGVPGAGAWSPQGGGPVVSGPVPTAVVTDADAGGPAAISSAMPTADVPGGGNQKETVLHSDVPLALVKHPYNYFLSMYAPVLIAVLLRLLLGYLFRSTKLVDPFFMLSDPEGSPFPLWDDHLGCETVFAPWFAIKCRRWLLLLTAVAYAASQLLAPFASELTAIQLGMYNLDHGYVRGHSIWINPVIARLLETLLGIIFILVVFIWVMLRRAKSSVRTNPGSIATIASLVGHPTTARDLSVNQWADKATTARLFEGRRYRLESYMANGVECYGIVPVGDMPGPMQDAEDAHAPVSRSVAQKDSVNLFLITASAAVLFGIILAYLKTSTSTSLERFMDSQTFGPRFLLSALGLLLKSPLLALCARTAASVPFSRLAKRPRREVDIVTAVPITPQGAIGYTLKRRAWFAGGVAVVSGVIIEVLLILLPGVPFNTRLSWNAARASWFGSLTCLGLILLVAIIGWARLFAKSNEWPKSPTTVGAIAMYVAGTSMSADRAIDGDTVPARRVYYEFGMRSGRWVVDYSFKGSGDRMTSVYSVQNEKPSAPSYPTHYEPRDIHSPISPAPSYTPFNPVQDTRRRSSGFNGSYSGYPQHHRAASYGGQPTPYPSGISSTRNDRNSLAGTESYPGRPQYGV